MAVPPALTKYPVGHSTDIIEGLVLIQILIGITIGENGHFVPSMIAGSITSTIGTGLMMTLDTQSGHSAWISYQVLTGMGLGLCFSVPIIVTQRSAQAWGSGACDSNCSM